MAHGFTAFSPWSLGEVQHHGLGRGKGLFMVVESRETQMTRQNIKNSSDQVPSP